MKCIMEVEIEAEGIGVPEVSLQSPLLSWSSSSAFSRCFLKSIQGHPLGRQPNVLFPMEQLILTFSRYLISFNADVFAESFLAVSFSSAYPVLLILMVVWPAQGWAWAHLSLSGLSGNHVLGCVTGCQFWAAGFTFWSVKCVDKQRHEKPVYDGWNGPRSTWHTWLQTVQTLIVCDCWDTGIHITYWFQLIILTKGDSDDCSNVFINSDLFLSGLWMLDSKVHVSERERKSNRENNENCCWKVMGLYVPSSLYQISSRNAD